MFDVEGAADLIVAEIARQAAFMTTEEQEIFYGRIHYLLQSKKPRL